MPGQMDDCCPLSRVAVTFVVCGKQCLLGSTWLGQNLGQLAASPTMATVVKSKPVPTQGLSQAKTSSKNLPRSGASLSPVESAFCRSPGRLGRPRAEKSLWQRLLLDQTSCPLNASSVFGKQAPDLSDPNTSSPGSAFPYAPPARCYLHATFHFPPGTVHFCLSSARCKPVRRGHPCQVGGCIPPVLGQLGPQLPVLTLSDCAPQRA